MFVSMRNKKDVSIQAQTRTDPRNKGKAMRKEWFVLGGQSEAWGSITQRGVSTVAG